MPATAQTERFIPPGVQLEKGAPELAYWAGFSADDLRARWQTDAGKAILAKWKADGFGRSTLDTLVGRWYGHSDLRGAPLDGLDLSGVDLSLIDFYSASFRGSTLYGADLSASWLSHTDLRGANLRIAKVDGVLIDGADFDAKTSFVGVNVNGINFTLATQLQDLATSQQRIADLEMRSPALALILRVTCDYGRSISRFFLWAAGVIVFFALAYLGLGCLKEPGAFNAVYFSVITFTTLGFGDIVPVTILGKCLAMSEALIGVLMLGLLVGILSRRVIG